MEYIERFRKYLTAYTDGIILGSFRIIFGLVMVYEMLVYFRIGLIKNAFFLPKIRLPYEYFAFLEPLPEPIMNLLLGLMLLSAVCLTLGLLLRPACLVLGSFHLYFLLLDKSLFNNHIYLFIILSFLFAVTHADRFLSVKQLFGKVEKKELLIPRWEIFIFQLMFAIVYFYGGLAKINMEWLVELQPMKEMLAQFPPSHWMSSLLQNDFMVYFLTYGGLVFDLVIPFLLWNKATRKWALIPILFFHLPNSQIFSDIGVFPFAMLLATILYFETNEIPFLRNLLPKKRKGKTGQVVKLEWPAWVGKLVFGFFVLQLLFPFRGFFLPNPMDWTSIGNRFAWRMKIQTRQIEEFAFFVQDGTSGEKQRVPINQIINPMQILSVAHDARAAAHVGKELARQARALGIKDPSVTANIKVKWNGRQGAYTIDSRVDLSKVKHSPFKKIKWIMAQPD